MNHESMFSLVVENNCVIEGSICASLYKDGEKYVVIVHFWKNGNREQSWSETVICKRGYSKFYKLHPRKWHGIEKEIKGGCILLEHLKSCKRTLLPCASFEVNEIEYLNSFYSQKLTKYRCFISTCQDSDCVAICKWTMENFQDSHKQW